MTENSGRVTQIQTRTARIQLPRGLQVGDSFVDHREYAAVQIRTADGLVGKAYCLSRNAPIVEIIDRLISPHVIGSDPVDVPDIWERAMRATAIIGRVGLVRKALGLIDIALWDIAAQRSGVPLWQMLGRSDEPRPTVLVAAYPTPDRTARDVADEVLGRADEGWRLLKIARTPHSELMRATVKILARELPSDVGLIVDASFGWKTADEALTEIATWGGVRLAWLEDPLVPEDAEGCSRLRRESGLRIGVGDEVTDPMVIRRLVESEAIDVARVDVVALGGVTPTIGVIEELQKVDLPISAHVYPEVTVHLGVGVETFSREPHGNAYDPAPVLISGGPTFADGTALPPRTSGLGFELNENAFGGA